MSTLWDMEQVHSGICELRQLVHVCVIFSGWLEPLLERIALNPNTSVCPVIETIDDTTFTPRESHFVQMGGFYWDLTFNWFEPGKAKLDMRKSSADVLMQVTHWGILTPLMQHLSQYYSDVIMSAMVSQLTSLTIIYSTVYSGAGQRKFQSSASLAFVRGIHRWPVNSLHNSPRVLQDA